MLKKIMILALVSLVITSCSQSEEQDDNKPYIVFAAPFESQPIWDKTKVGFFEACEAFEFHCDWKGPSNISTDYMENVFHEAIMKKADGIITQGVVDPELLDLAAKESIPVILVDSDIEGSTRLGYFVKDFDKQADLLMKNIVSKIGDKQMNIAVQVAELDFDIAQDQIRSLEEVLKKYGSNHRIVVVSESKSDPIKARAGWREVLKNQNSINIIINFAGESAKESAFVVDELNLENILIYGVDELSETLQLIKEGKVEGTIVTSFYDYGYNSVRLLYNHINNIQVTEGTLGVKLDLITKENINDFIN